MDDVRCVWPAAAVLGEGPLWDEDEEALYWVDIKAPAVHRYVPGTGSTESWPMPEPVGCIARRRQGGFIAGFKSGLAFLDLPDGRIERIGDPEPDLPDNRFNDGKCDGAGRFWAGTMDDGQKSATGSLYRVDADRRWHRMDSGYGVTNGPAFSPDGRTLYHTDSAAGTIFAFDAAPDGSISDKRTFIEIPPDAGHPDGMTVDAEGHLWVAHWDGWRLTRFRPDATVERVIEIPVARVTSCAFGGPALDRLYVTTASTGLDAEARARQPLAGGLFEAPVGVRGLPAPRFAG